MKVKSLRRVSLFATPWTAAHQAPPSMGFSRQEDWSGVPSPSPTTSIVTFIKHTYFIMKIIYLWGISFARMDGGLHGPSVSLTTTLMPLAMSRCMTLPF